MPMPSDQELDGLFRQVLREDEDLLAGLAGTDLDMSGRLVAALGRRRRRYLASLVLAATLLLALAAGAVAVGSGLVPLPGERTARPTPSVPPSGPVASEDDCAAVQAFADVGPVVDHLVQVMEQGGDAVQFGLAWEAKTRVVDRAALARQRTLASPRLAWDDPALRVLGYVDVALGDIYNRDPGAARATLDAAALALRRANWQTWYVRQACGDVAPLELPLLMRYATPGDAASSPSSE